MKRLFDIVVSSMALAILAAPLLVVMLAIRVSDGGPALYRQWRVGLNCKPFQILKFRSMVLNADMVGSYMTGQNDARITSIGRVLRRTSIDELPQLWNVLRGEMSLVGPRPDVPAQETLYAPDAWAMRHSVRPGVTGLAQATSRSTATLAERIEMDLKYVRRATLWFDLRILGMTVRHIFARTGN